MRTILLAAAIAGAASVITTTHADAQYAAWCSEYTRGGGTNCGFYTYEQCLANISGIGGWCYPNPHVVAAPSYRSGFFGPGIHGTGPVYVQRKRKLRRGH